MDLMQRLASNLDDIGRIGARRWTDDSDSAHPFGDGTTANETSLASPAVADGANGSLSSSPVGVPDMGAVSAAAAAHAELAMEAARAVAAARATLDGGGGRGDDQLLDTASASSASGSSDGYDGPDSDELLFGGSATALASAVGRSASEAPVASGRLPPSGLPPPLSPPPLSPPSPSHRAPVRRNLEAVDLDAVDADRLQRILNSTADGRGASGAGSAAAHRPPARSYDGF